VSARARPRSAPLTRRGGGGAATGPQRALRPVCGPRTAHALIGGRRASCLSFPLLHPTPPHLHPSEPKDGPALYRAVLAASEEAKAAAASGAKPKTYTIKLSCGAKYVMETNNGTGLVTEMFNGTGQVGGRAGARARRRATLAGSLRSARGMRWHERRQTEPRSRARMTLATASALGRSAPASDHTRPNGDAATLALLCAQIVIQGPPKCAGKGKPVIAGAGRSDDYILGVVFSGTAKLRRALAFWAGPPHATGGSSLRRCTLAATRACDVSPAASARHPPLPHVVCSNFVIDGM
jgi:hypothetical protein